jgi:hypothetical protein
MHAEEITNFNGFMSDLVTIVSDTFMDEHQLNLNQLLNKYEYKFSPLTRISLTEYLGKVENWYDTVLDQINKDEATARTVQKIAVGLGGLVLGSIFSYYERNIFVDILSISGLCVALGYLSFSNKVTNKIYNVIADAHMKKNNKLFGEIKGDLFYELGLDTRTVNKIYSFKN